MKFINPTLSKSFAAGALVLGMAAGQAQALNVLTFDTSNPERNTSVGALGFSITQVGSSSVADLDFSAYDVIYIAHSYQEFMTSSLLGALGTRFSDLAAYVSAGGGIVFGSPAIGGVEGSGAIGSGPIVQNVDLNTLGLLPLLPLPTLPGLTPVAEDGFGNSTILTAGFGDGRVVGWNPISPDLQVTGNSLQLVENSLNWAAGDVAAVPEPGTYALFGMGMIGLFLFRRKAKA